LPSGRKIFGKPARELVLVVELPFSAGARALPLPRPSPLAIQPSTPPCSAFGSKCRPNCTRSCRICRAGSKSQPSLRPGVQNGPDNQFCHTRESTTFWGHPGHGRIFD
jgi:hypothetical protein